MASRANRSSRANASLTNEEIHIAVTALTRSLAHEVHGLMEHRHPSFGIYTRLRDEARALYVLVDWVHEDHLFGREQEAPARAEQRVAREMAAEPAGMDLAVDLAQTQAHTTTDR